MRILWTGMVACALVLASGTVTAGSEDHAPHVQSSMLVTGTITIKPDGSVANYTLDRKDKLPPGVLKTIAKTVSHWMFQPVLKDGKAVLAKSPMSLTLVANPIGQGQYGIAVDGVFFGDIYSGEYVTPKHVAPPTYPRWLVRKFVTGTAYVVVQVGRDGHIERAKVWHVDLRIKGTPAQMKRWRKGLAEACLRAAKDWTYNTPVKGPRRDDDHWLGTVPVTFALYPWSQEHPKRTPYGRWRTYIPGPEHYIPWINQHMLTASTNVLPTNGGFYPMQQSLHLLKPLGDGS